MARGVRLDNFHLGLLALALGAVPAVGQVAPATTNNSSSSSTVVGPQLRDFNLNGTVTRPAAPPAATPATPRPNSPAATAATGPDRPAPEETTPRRSAQARPVGSVDRSAAPSESPPQAPISPPAVAPTPTASVPPLPATQLPGEPSSGPDFWPWLLAGLVAAGAGLFLFRRRHQQARLAGAGARADLDLPSAEPAPQPLRRAPTASPAPKSTPTGIVSTRMHPDLDIEVLPERAIVDEQGATIELQIAIRNHGSAPARDVHVEACMVNAGPSQDQELGAFFAHPANSESPIPHIMPMTEILLRSAVRLKIDKMRQFEVAGRRLFVPLVGVNAVYRGPSGASQMSTSYLVGRDGKGEKMAPLRLDLGPRIFRGLGVRQHTLGLRK